MNKKAEDLKNLEQKQNVCDSNGLTCDECNFVGKNKTGLTKHIKTKHGKKSIDESKLSQLKQSSGNDDEFTNTVNNFLKSVNHLNNSNKTFSCLKCSATFGSKEFLDIHTGATHKTKCEVCDFETGHSDLMMEHIASPGIWHKSNK